MHEHENDHYCKHLNLKYCEVCKAVYCVDCKKEWREYIWTFTYPNLSVATPDYTLPTYNISYHSHT